MTSLANLVTGRRTFDESAQTCLPFEFALSFVEDIVLAINSDNAVLERCLPLVLDALHLVEQAENDVAISCFLNSLGKVIVGIVKIGVDGIFFVNLLVLVRFTRTIELCGADRGRGGCGRCVWSSS